MWRMYAYLVIVVGAVTLSGNAGAQVALTSSPRTIWTDASIRQTPPSDPVKASQVLELAERTFPNLSVQLEAAQLLERAAMDPSVRGNLRGRLAEHVFEQVQSANGWKRVAKSNAPENDFWNLSAGRGAQIKVHSDIGDYHRSMKSDRLAEHFVVPDDHYDLLKRDLELRRDGALRSGDHAKATEYGKQAERLTKLGHTFAELDGSIGAAQTHYRHLAVAMRHAGQATSFIAGATMILEGGVAIYQFASGTSGVEKFALELAKVGVTGATVWAVGPLAAKAAAAAGATGNIPVAVAVVASATAVLVVDWAFDATTESITTARLTPREKEQLWRTRSPSRVIAPPGAL